MTRMSYPAVVTCALLTSFHSLTSCVPVLLSVRTVASSNMTDLLEEAKKVAAIAAVNDHVQVCIQ